MLRKFTLPVIAGLSFLLSILGSPAMAATPASGTLTTTNATLTYTSGPFFVANASAQAAGLGVTSLQCNPSQAFPCDDYALTITLPAGYAAAHPYDMIKISTAYPKTPQEDFDTYLIDASGNQAAAANGPWTENPEVMRIPAVDGTHTYTIRIIPTQPLGDSTTTTVTLVAGSVPVITPFSGLPPRYNNLVPPSGVGVGSQGEFNIGFNPKTGNILVFNGGPVFRVTPPEKLNPPMPQSGDATWTDVTPLVVSTPAGLDPILVTEQGSGRTIASNFTGGANLEYAYSDDDGTTWTQLGASPANFSADHETIGTGAYPAGSPFAVLAQTAGANYATYYCAQSEAPAFCQRSDNGGASYGNGVPIYNGVTSNCSAIHGHVRVAPNGTVYVPNRACGTHQGAAVSSDAGVTWHETLVPASSTAPGFDPSIGIASDSTAYFCYVNGDGHPHVSVSHDDGQTWVNDFDIGAAQGIQNAVFVEATAGDPNRAACGFVGTTQAGNWQSTAFPGIWYLYIATTYDGGQTWATVSANPSQPVQGAGGICASGIACSSTPNNRNLLDFNEVTHDDKGRVLFGYDVGCISNTCLQDPSKNDFIAAMRIARQSGGRPLFAKYDPAEPAAPQAPFLSGVRDSTGAHLSWKAPDNGGSDINNYKIYRATTPGNETLLGQTGSNKTSFNDTKADPAVANYFYRVTAVNGQGEGPVSNELPLAATTGGPAENICLFPGVTILTDATGDNIPPLPGTDLKSFQLTQAYAADGNIKLVFTINTDPGQVPQPIGSSWYVSFKEPDGKVHAVHMTWKATSPGTPSFESYIAAPNNSGGVDGRFVDPATVKPADSHSGYDAANGKVVIVVALTDLGLKPGDMIAGFNSAVTQTTDVAGVGAGGTAIIDSMPDSLGYVGNYKVNPNSFCAPDSPPVAALSASPMSGTAPLTVNFDASQSHDADGDAIASYHFVFGDGTEETRSTATTSHQYNTTGDFPAQVQVTDARGKQSTQSTQVIISVTRTNHPPVAALSGPSTAAVNQSVTFDASGSSDPDGDTLSYAFDFGDGTTVAAGPASSASHAFGSAGSYSVTVVVRDPAGASDSKSLGITVSAGGGGGGMSASLSADRTDGTAPLNVTLTAAAGGTHSNGLSYTFVYGDGTQSAAQAGPSSVHRYDAAGTYHPYVIINDDSGHSAVSDHSSAQRLEITARASVVVTPGQETVAMLTLNGGQGSVSGPAPLSVSFDGSRSFAASGTQLVSYSFDFGDGAAVVSGTGAPGTVSHIYAVPGHYTPTLTVTDSANHSAKAQAEAQIAPNPANVPPAGGQKGGGGAFGWLSLLPLLAAAIKRRRMR